MEFSLQDAVALLIEKKNLTSAQMRSAILSLYTQDVPESLISAFLIALRMKGETIEEITAAAKVLREHVLAVNYTHPNMVDTAGTGGDGANTFNISTASCFVIAAAGGVVAKHGNRAASSKSGSADVLQTAGLEIELTPEQVIENLKKHKLAFIFAPKFHASQAKVRQVRKQLKVYTLYNMLGPLTNPAQTKQQIMGVFSEKLVEPIAHVLKELGLTHAMVVHAEDNLDEISIAAPTKIAELKDNQVTTYYIKPEDFGLQTQTLDSIIVNSPKQSLEILLQSLDKTPSAARDIVILNAGAAIYIAGLADSLQNGINTAKEMIISGVALNKFQEIRNDQ